MKLKTLIRNYRQAINPPYSRKDFPFIAGTLLILLIATAFVVNLPNKYKSKQTQNSNAQSSNPQPTVNAVPDEILLRFKPGAKQNIQDRIFSEQGLTLKEEIKQIEVKVVKVAPQARDHVIEALSHNPATDFAEVNEIAKAKPIKNVIF